MGIILAIFSLSGKTPVLKDVLKTWVSGLIIVVITRLTIFILSPSASVEVLFLQLSTTL